MGKPITQQNNYYSLYTFPVRVCVWTGKWDALIPFGLGTAVGADTVGEKYN